MQKDIIEILMELGFPAHRVGFGQLCRAVERYALDSSQLLSKELYPAIAQELGYYDWRAVEHSIRDVIVSAWKRRDAATWGKYFPGCRKAPSNKRFVATLAQFLR